MRDLSILIPARNEAWLSNTIDDILKNKQGDTEIIAVLDGYWPEVGINDHPDLKLIHKQEAIGQRAATNLAARISQAKYVMKADAHCSFDKGFDVKLMESCRPDWTMIPRMYNLHVFDWVCEGCGNRLYQGPDPGACPKCQKQYKMELIWKRRKSRRADFMRFDENMHFQYWNAYKKRPESKGDIVPLLCAIGACWMMERKRYNDIGGLDEAHGSWGQMGVEIACKSWLSGGQQMVNKKTWFAHMFRTRKGFSFPYKIKGSDVEKARKRSKALWQGNAWGKAVHSLELLLDKFYPVPGWHEDNVSDEKLPTLSKGIVYYTDNRLEERIMSTCQKLINLSGIPVVSVSQYPISFGQNIVMDLGRSTVSMFRQILKGLQECDADIIYLCEHDVMYHPSHFDFVPKHEDIFYYNKNRWQVDSVTGKAVTYDTRCPSMLVAHKSLLLKYYTKRLKILEAEGFKGIIGHSPPNGVKGVGHGKSFHSKHPCIDIAHGSNLTKKRFNKSEFKSPRATKGWVEADSVPFWGKTKKSFNNLLKTAIITIERDINMKDSFDGTQTIRLQPGSDAVPFTFTFAINSSAIANDGAIPFGDTIASSVTKCFAEDGTDVSAAVVDSESNTTTVVTVALNYPAAAGRYSLEFVLTFTSGSGDEFDFTRVYAEDVAA